MEKERTERQGETMGGREGESVRMRKGRRKDGGRKEGTLTLER